MKKQALLLLSSVFLLFGSAVYFLQTQSSLGAFKLESKSDITKPSLNKEQGIREALQWRFERLKDEYGNFYASYFYGAQSHADAMKQSGSRSGLGLQWEELGPDNVGGRTRAILIDKRDVSNNTIYAGGVGGGMWKSLDGGNTWTALPNWNQWMAVSCITQGPAPDHSIYIGTGEGLSSGGGTSMNSGSVGNGIYKLDANDNPVRITPDNFATNWISGGDSFSWVNRVAADPMDNGHLIAGTTKGLYETFNGGSTWDRIHSAYVSGILQTAAISAGMVDDVKFAHDGRNVFAAANGGNSIFKSVDGGYTWNKITSATDPGFPATQGRMEIAIAPSDPNRVYLLIATAAGQTYGVYKTDSANNGVNSRWYTIGNKSPLFDPFTAENQGWYDNTIAVSPGDPNKIYVGGVVFYTWSDQTGWKLDDAGFSGISDPHYIHPDKHTIVISETDSNILFIGCDGGIHKSYDAVSSFPYCTFRPMNRGYNVTQNYSIAAAITGEVMGGSQDNGTNYVNYLGNTRMSGQMVEGGDGTFAEISHIDPRISFAGVYYAQTGRNGNYVSPFSFTGFYDVKVDPHGRGTTGVCQPGATSGAANGGDAPFVTEFYLCETRNAAHGFKSVTFVCDRPYNAGDVISLQSGTANYPFQYIFTAAHNHGDVILVADPIRSRFFETSNCGVWLTSDALNLSIIPRWFHLTSGSLVGEATSYSSSPDGNLLYVGTASGRVYKFPNLNAKCDTARYKLLDTVTVIYTAANQYSNYSVASGGRRIEGVSVDPADTNHVAVAVAGFSAANAPHVYETHDGGAHWTPDTAGLPNMPVYSIIVHDANTIIIGTELGIWSWDGLQWHEENNVMPRVPVYRMIEKELYNESCKVLYVGTHGRGMWRCTTLTTGGCNTVVGTGINEVNNNAVTGLNIFPNPMSSSSKISITIDKPADITLRVFDMTGKLYKDVTYRNADSGENFYELDASGLSNGTYLLAATVGNTRTKSKLFVVSK